MSFYFSFFHFYRHNGEYRLLLISLINQARSHADYTYWGAAKILEAAV